VIVAVDTNVLVRASTLDDPHQSAVAADLLTREQVCVPTVALCEYAWVLRAAYQRSRAEIAASIRALVESPNVRCDRAMVDQGLAMLQAGGDFADAVIAYQGQWLGASEFVTFDRRAAELLPGLGMPARALG
jgi:predicted nucleic-acid-binding protein